MYLRPTVEVGRRYLIQMFTFYNSSIWYFIFSTCWVNMRPRVKVESRYLLSISIFDNSHVWYFIFATYWMYMRPTVDVGRRYWRAKQTTVYPARLCSSQFWPWPMITNGGRGPAHNSYLTILTPSHYLGLQKVHQKVRHLTKNGRNFALSLLKSTPLLVLRCWLVWAITLQIYLALFYNWKSCRNWRAGLGGTPLPKLIWTFFQQGKSCPKCMQGGGY